MPSAVMSRYLPCRRVCPLLRDKPATEFVSAQLAVILPLSVLTSKRVGRILHDQDAEKRRTRFLKRLTATLLKIQVFYGVMSC
jgi:hypothetical protein